MNLLKKLIEARCLACTICIPGLLLPPHLHKILYSMIFWSSFLENFQSWVSGLHNSGRVFSPLHWRFLFYVLISVLIRMMSLPWNSSSLKANVRFLRFHYEYFKVCISCICPLGGGGHGGGVTFEGGGRKRDPSHLQTEHGA